MPLKLGARVTRPSEEKLLNLAVKQSIVRAIRRIPDDVGQQGFQLAAGGRIAFNVSGFVILGMTVKEVNHTALIVARGEAVLAIGRVDGVVGG